MGTTSSTEEETSDLLHQKPPRRSRITYPGPPGYEPIWAAALALVLGAMAAAAVFLLTVVVVIPSCHRAAECPQQQEQPGQAAAGTAVADTSITRCSGHGVWWASDPKCHCYSCYTGAACETEIFLDECTVDARAGEPFLFEEYWAAHPEAALHMLPSEHLGYEIRGMEKLARLKQAILGVHAMVGNAVTEGRQLVIGTGSSAVMLAAVWALSQRNASADLSLLGSGYFGGFEKLLNQGPTEPFQMWASPPAHYDGYGYLEYALPGRVSWADQMPTSSERTIEFVCSPNNPDGLYKTKQLPGAHAIHDHAYLWPQFAPIKQAVAYGPEDIALFTLSKMTGHAGSRVGWALVGDPVLAMLMEGYLQVSGGVPSENQARAAVLLEHVLGSQGDIFNFGRAEMQRRWAALERIEASSSRFSFQVREEPVLDTWSGQVQPWTPPYLFVHCLDSQRDPDCWETLKTAGLLGYPGGMYGTNASFARLELIGRRSSADFLLTKLEQLAAA